MGKFFLPILVGTFLWILPFLFVGDTYVDTKRQKAIFSLRLFGLIRILGGYITLIGEGVSFHISDKKAIFLPFNDVETGKKQFNVLKLFRFLRIGCIIETSPSNFLQTLMIKRWIAPILSVLTKGEVEGKVYVYSKEQFSLCVHSKFWINGVILTTRFISFIIEKWRLLWRKKQKKSII